jgi:hypothetical protein
LKPSVRLGLLSLFIVLAAAFSVTQYGGADVAQAQPAGVAKTCSLSGSITSPTAATAFTCTVTITAPYTSPLGLAITSPTGAVYTNVSVTGSATLTPPETYTVTPAPGPTGFATPVTSFTITCTGGPTAADCDATPVNPIIITEFISAPAGVTGDLEETFTSAGTTFALPEAPALTFVAAPVVTPIGAVTKACVPAPDGVPAPSVTAPLTVGAPAVFVRAGQTVTCTVTVTAPTGGTVTPAGTATVTLVGAVFAGGSSTGTFTCVAVTPATTPPSCSFVESFFVAESAACAFLPSETIAIGGSSFAVAVTTGPAVTTIGGVSVPAGTGIFVLPKVGSGVVCPISPGVTLNQPKFLDFECKGGIDTFGDPIIPIIPGEIGGVFVDAIGVLPGALICQVVLLDAAGLEIAAPGGKIEVSSINGTLVDASGQLTTNLRIQCGSIPSPVTGGTVFAGLGTVGVTGLANDCLGVQFAVLGRGVGFVELNARYEPNAFAIQAGIHEAEGVGSVAFIAPAVDIDLTLSPNPATVNDRVTATVFFNEVITTVAGVPLIDPTTGIPFTTILGSRLSGNVVFSTSSTSVAPFIGTQISLTGQEAIGTAEQPSTEVSGQFTGVTQSVTVRCGGLGVLGSAATFASFFQGCDTAAAVLLARAQGSATISGTFIPDLPGAFGAGQLIGGTANLDAAAALLGLFAPAVGGLNTDSEVLLVIGEAPTGNVQLSRGCNNVSPTVTETAAAYAARVDPAAALVAIWEHQAATNTFRGWSPQAGAPNDLTGVTRLRPVFVCVSAAATLNQPPA